MCATRYLWQAPKVSEWLRYYWSQAKCSKPRSRLPSRQVIAMLKTRVSRASHFGAWLAGVQQAPTPQEEVYSAYRQRQAQSRPPAMPTNASLPRQPGRSQPASYGSDYGSLDRSSMSGSEATSPVKSMEVCDLCTCPWHNTQGACLPGLTGCYILSGLCVQARYEAKTKYVQPTPFGVREQPSFDEYDETDCVVCMDDVRCTIFVPCGHCLCCQSCAEIVVQKYKHCPVCSTPVDGFCATLS